VDFTVRGLLREMDAAGVGAGILLALQEAPSVEDTLEETERLHQESGGRLLPASTVDPTKGLDEVEHAIRLWERARSLYAIKLYPGYLPFFPHDPRLSPVYEFAARRRIPVMFHQGDTLDPNGLVKYTRPLDLDEVAVRYREVRFVICHLGNPWIDEASEMVYKNENVFTDTSGLLWPPTLPLFPLMIRHARQRLLDAISNVGDASKFLYGSDWPLESLELAVKLVDELDLSRADRDRILGGNARTLFRVP
jgi:predicted TIM-barrel fold metal-dependent hydrolase